MVTVRSSIAALRSYPEQATRGVRMDLNMNIVLPPPDLARIAGAYPIERVNEYPSQESTALREALAKRFDVPPAQVIVANGSRSDTP